MRGHGPDQEQHSGDRQGETETEHLPPADIAKDAPGHHQRPGDEDPPERHGGRPAHSPSPPRQPVGVRHGRRYRPPGLRRPTSRFCAHAILPRTEECSLDGQLRALGHRGRCTDDSVAVVSGVGSSVSIRPGLTSISPPTTAHRERRVDRMPGDGTNATGRLHPQRSHTSGTVVLVPAERRWGRQAAQFPGR